MANYDDLRRKWEAATKGEWEGGLHILHDGDHEGLQYCAIQTPVAEMVGYFPVNDVKFIAAAHNQLPGLLGELEAMAAEKLRLQGEVDACRKELLLSRGNFATLRKLTEAVLPENMGGYPDLFCPDGFHGGNDSADPWELWESAVKIELKHIDEAARLRAEGGE